GGYLDFPVVNIMNINNQIKEARANYSKQMATSTKAEQDIELEIQTAYYNLVEKQNQIPVAFLGMKQAKENYDISFGRYKVGEGSPIELKDSQITYMNSQLSYYNALYQYNSAKANLEKAIGKNLMFGEEVVDLTKTDNKE
ncbi:TolC family protein, partial [bacterium]|nr:TolC family protein [bacterium]